MANYKMSALSKQFIKVPVSVTVAGQAYNPTSDTVWMAFTSSATVPPTTNDWRAAQWEIAGTTYYAMTLHDPASNGLVAGTYEVWVKVSDTPEIPVFTATNKLVVF